MHCWRGGMRSGFYAWLLEFYGFKIYTLKGGYKSFRNKIMDMFNTSLQLLIVGGKTGSGKTYILHELKNAGEQVIDLESIAQHKGSSFGSLGQSAAPTQEMFENRLGMEIMELDRERVIWLEDESRAIGNKVLPAGLWNQMRDSKMFFLEIPFERRLDHIISDYGKFSKEELISATDRIRKRLGNEQCDAAIEALKEDNLPLAFSFSLKYYDKAYLHNVKNRDAGKIVQVNAGEIHFNEIASELIRLASAGSFAK